MAIPSNCKDPANHRRGRHTPACTQRPSYVRAAAKPVGQNDRRFSGQTQQDALP